MSEARNGGAAERSGAAEPWSAEDMLPERTGLSRTTETQANWLRALDKLVKGLTPTGHRVKRRIRQAAQKL